MAYCMFQQDPSNSSDATQVSRGGKQKGFLRRWIAVNKVQSAWVSGEKADSTRILGSPKLLCLRYAILLCAFRSNNGCMHELTEDHTWLNFNIALKYQECLYWPRGRSTAGELWNQNMFLQYMERIRGLCPLIKRSCRLFGDL